MPPGPGSPSRYLWKASSPLMHHRCASLRAASSQPKAWSSGLLHSISVLVNSRSAFQYASLSCAWQCPCRSHPCEQRTYVKMDTEMQQASIREMNRLHLALRSFDVADIAAAIGAVGFVIPTFLGTDAVIAG